MGANIYRNKKPAIIFLLPAFLFIDRKSVV